MKRFSLCLLLLTIGLLTHAQTLVSFSTGLYTYPEIAARLSVDGDKVECAPELKERAALLTLKPRSWREACKVLCEGLDLQLRKKKDKDNQFVLQPKDEVAAREKKWLSVLKNSIAQSLTKRLDAFRPYSKMTFEQLIPLYEDTEKQVEELRKRKDAESQRKEQDLRFNVLMDMYSFLSPTDWAVLQWLIAQPPLTINDLTKQESTLVRAPDWLLKTPFIEAPSDEMSEAARSKESAPQEPVYVPEFILAGLRFNPSDLRLQVQLTPCRPGLRGAVFGSIGFGDLYPSSMDFDLIGQPLLNKAPFTADSSQLTITQNERTNAYLETEASKKAFKFEYSPTSQTLSQVMAQWSRDKNSELVMELHPLRETYSQWRESVYLQEEKASLAELFPLQTHKISRAKKGRIITARHPWTLEEQNKVLFVKSKFAFLDHTLNLPLQALVKLVRNMQPKALKKPEEPQKQASAPLKKTFDPLLLDYDLMLDYYRQSTPVQNKGWFDGYRRIHNYWGINLEAVAKAQPIIQLLQKAPSRDFQDAWQQFLKGERTRLTQSFPMASFSPADLERFVADLKAGGFNAYAWHPDFMQQLAASTFEVDAFEKYDKTLRQVSIDIVDKSGGKRTLYAGAQLELQPVVAPQPSANAAK